MAFVILHQSIVDRDAIGWDIQQEYRILSRIGRCYLYCDYLVGITGCARISRDEMFDFVQDPDNTMVYHHSNFWAEGEELLKHARCPIVIRYHNITPPSFFRHLPDCWRACVLGREQTFRFAHMLPDALWLPDSLYNIQELGLEGLNHISVVPPFAGLAHSYGIEPDGGLLKSLLEDPRLNVLCIGRIVPNKGHLFVVEVIKHYVRTYGRDIVVFVAGKLDPLFESYHDEVIRTIREYDLADNFRYAGVLTDAQLLSHYLGSDLYLCCSEHEGFCVPLAESQFAHLPIVARNRSVVPETLGAGQILLGEDPAEYAAAMHRLRSCAEFREQTIQAGRRNYDSRFTPLVIETAFMEAVTSHTCAVL